jgi:hypothetical protein
MQNKRGSLSKVTMSLPDFSPKKLVMCTRTSAMVILLKNMLSKTLQTCHQTQLHPKWSKNKKISTLWTSHPRVCINACQFDSLIDRQQQLKIKLDKFEEYCGWRYWTVFASPVQSRKGYLIGGVNFNFMFNTKIQMAINNYHGCIILGEELSVKYFVFTFACVLHNLMCFEHLRGIQMSFQGLIVKGGK